MVKWTKSGVQCTVCLYFFIKIKIKKNIKIKKKYKIIIYTEICILIYISTTTHHVYTLYITRENTSGDGAGYT